MPIPRLVEEIGSFDNERKRLVLFLGPFRGSFFHQGLQWFFLFLFPAVFAFAHNCYSLINASLKLGSSISLSFILRCLSDLCCSLLNNPENIYHNARRKQTQKTLEKGKFGEGVKGASFHPNSDHLPSFIAFGRARRRST